jgi:hypothetical protein
MRTSSYLWRSHRGRDRMVVGFITVTRRVPNVEQEMFPLPVHLELPLIYNGVPVALSLVFCTMICGSLFVRQGQDSNLQP